MGNWDAADTGLMACWVLVHSPLLSPMFWGPVAAMLRGRGQLVFTADMSGALAKGRGYADTQADLVASAVDSDLARLVAHSGAGPILPVMAEKLRSRGVTVSDSVFVDAGLPHPGHSRFAVLPEPAVAHLLSMIVDGWLPPWPSWWSPEELREMVSDADLRRQLVAACPQLPVGLFSEPMPAGDQIAMGRLRFCRLSSTYDTAADQAARDGWEVMRLATHHLAPMTDPESVTDAIQELAAR